jgi:hypothetical protein
VYCLIFSLINEAKQNFYNNMLKESKDPKLIWKCTQPKPIKPHRLVTENDLKVVSES